MLLWILRNCGHELLTKNQLKNTLPQVRYFRNMFAGHVANTKLSYINFYESMRGMVEFLRDIDQTFPGTTNPDTML